MIALAGHADHVRKLRVSGQAFSCSCDVSVIEFLRAASVVLTLQLHVEVARRLDSHLSFLFCELLLLVIV